MRSRLMPLVLLLSLGTAVAACDGDSVQPVVDPPILPAMEADGVRAAVVLEEQSGDEVTVAIHVDARALELGAYQGRLEYDTGSLTLLDIETPSGQDEFRIANGADAGLVRFAGFTAGAFTSPVAVRLRLLAADELTAESLALILDVAGTVGGAAVAPSEYQTPRALFRGPSWTAR